GECTHLRAHAPPPRWRHCCRHLAYSRPQTLGRAALTAIVQSAGRRCRLDRPGQSRQQGVPVAMDRLAPMQYGTRLVARRHLRPDARMCGGEVSFRSLPLWSVYSITSSARASRLGEISMPSDPAVTRLMTNSNLVGCSYREVGRPHSTRELVAPG